MRSRPSTAPRGVLILLALALGAHVTGCGATPSAERRGPSPEALRSYTQAGLAEQAGDHAEAARLYDDAAVADPESSEIWLASARARGRLGQWDAAVERNRRAVELEAQSPSTLDALGRTLMKAGQLDEARAVFQGLAEREPKVAEGWSGLAALAELDGDIETAEQHLSRAVGLDPERAADWERLGGLRQRLGRVVPAAVAFNEAAARDPQRRTLDPRTLMMALEGGDRDVARAVADRMAGDEAGPGAGSMAIAALILRRGDPLGAANELEWLLERQPDHTGARLLLGRTLVRVDRVAEAEAQLAQIPAGTREWPDALRLRAMLALKAGEADRAVKLLGQARSVGPSEPEVVYSLAVALRRADRIAEARSELTVAVVQWPRDAAVRFLLALLIHEMDGEDAALGEMHRVIELDPDHAGALNYVGFTWAERGERLEEAEAMIRRALKQRPDDGAIVDSLGWVLFRQGRYEAAVDVLERAVELQGDAAEIRFHFAEALWAVGRRDEAREAYRQAIDGAKDPKEKARYRRAARKKGVR